MVHGVANLVLGAGNTPDAHFVQASGEELGTVVTTQIRRGAAEAGEGDIRAGALGDEYSVQVALESVDGVALPSHGQVVPLAIFHGSLGSNGHAVVGAAVGRDDILGAGGTPAGDDVAITILEPDGGLQLAALKPILDGDGRRAADRCGQTARQTDIVVDAVEYQCVTGRGHRTGEGACLAVTRAATAHGIGPHIVHTGCGQSCELARETAAPAAVEGHAIATFYSGIGVGAPDAAAGGDRCSPRRNYVSAALGRIGNDVGNRSRG